MDDSRSRSDVIGVYSRILCLLHVLTLFHFRIHGLALCVLVMVAGRTRKSSVCGRGGEMLFGWVLCVDNGVTMFREYTAMVFTWVGGGILVRRFDV